MGQIATPSAEPTRIADALVACSSDELRTAVRDVVGRLPLHTLRTLERFGTRIRVLDDDETYRDTSAELRRLDFDVDRYPVPPSGLYVIAERRILLRSTKPLVIVHECGHALDGALGGGTYISDRRRALRRCFDDARTFLTLQAAGGRDEYFAEAFRAVVSDVVDCNDAASPWMDVSPRRLELLDPTMYRTMNKLVFGRLAHTMLHVGPLQRPCGD